MHTEITGIDLLFEFSIFLLLLYKLCDLFKAHVIPFLHGKIIEARNYHTELLEKDKLLLSTRYRLENQINHQKQVFALLEKNVQTWYKLMKEERELQEQENRALIEKLNEKRKAQQRNITLDNALQKTLPSVLKHATLVFEKKYATSGEANSLHNIVSTLKAHND